MANAMESKARNGSENQQKTSMKNAKAMKKTTSMKKAKAMTKQKRMVEKKRIAQQKRNARAIKQWVLDVHESWLDTKLWNKKFKVKTMSFENWIFAELGVTMRYLG